jgi:pyruvate formate lyase activating enzyme
VSAFGIGPAVRRTLAAAPLVDKGRLGAMPSPYFTPLADKRVRCTLCPNGCEISAGERGACRVRENRDGRLVSLAYGNPCAVNIDPIEKKPFFHVLPGTMSFSIATAGCNFDCKFCQNWQISQARPDDTFNYDLPPDAVAAEAARAGCRSVASTYVEPTIFAEYMIDAGKAVRPAGMLNVMHSNGYIEEGPLGDLCKVLDAACIDLKGFSEAYYRDMTGGTLAPVLATLKRLKALGVHTEIVNLVVTGRNDDLDGIRSMCRWVRDELGPETPLHFTRFYPLYKLKSVEPTPVATLDRAREAGRAEGLRFVYVGNVPGHPGQHTDCPGCGARLIERVGFQSTVLALKDGKCTACGREIPGIWKEPGRA